MASPPANAQAATDSDNNEIRIFKIDSPKNDQRSSPPSTGEEGTTDSGVDKDCEVHMPFTTKTVKKRKLNGGPKMARNRAPPPINTLTAIRGPPLSSAAARKIMWDQYQPWVLSTYGDAAKTKTITTKKYTRIVALLRTLNGNTLTPILDKDGNLMATPETQGGSTSEAAKFKLWVKSKGFHLGPPPGHPDRGLPHTVDMLYLPTGTDKVSGFQLDFLCCSTFNFFKMTLHRKLRFDFQNKPYRDRKQNLYRRVLVRNFSTLKFAETNNGLK